jgi:hypothetical protein
MIETVNNNKGTLTKMKSTGAEPLERNDFAHRLFKYPLESRASHRPEQNNQSSGHKGY